MNPDSESVKQEYTPQEQPTQPQNAGFPAQSQQGGAYSYSIQQGHPAPQPGYPAPNQAGYPSPQQQPYPAPQQPYSQQLQQDAPPTFKEVDMPPPQPQQTQSTNVVVVQQQPTASGYTTTNRPVGDNNLSLSIVLTVVCFFLCSWSSLICVIPALILSINARNAEQRGDAVKARSYSAMSLRLNIVAIVIWVASAILFIISFSISAANNSRRNSN